MGKGHPWFEHCSHLDPGDLLAHQGTRSGPSRRPRRTRCPPARLRPERTATKGSSLATCHGRCAMGDHFFLVYILNIKNIYIYTIIYIYTYNIKTIRSIYYTMGHIIGIVWNLYRIGI
jgi:hypothetical protein